MLPVPTADLVTCLAGYTELPAHIGHSLAVQQAADEAKALLHYRTPLPQHLHVIPAKVRESVTHQSGTIHYLCVWGDQAVGDDVRPPRPIDSEIGRQHSANMRRPMAGALIGAEVVGDEFNILA